MSINDLPSASLSEEELAQQVAELEERVKRIGQPVNSFEWRRRAFFEDLVRIRRQQLDALRQSPSSRPNRREFPRIAVDLPAEIVGPSGGTAQVRLVNLARRGAGFVLSHDAVLAAFPRMQITPGQSASVQFQLLLSACKHVSIRAQCKIVWFCRVSEDDYRMGLQFSSFEGDGNSQVERYVLTCLNYS